MKHSVLPDGYEIRTVRLDGESIEIVVDTAHIAAHIDAFIVSFDRVIELVGRALQDDRTGEVKRAIRAPYIVGLSKCVRLRRSDRPFWGIRAGRNNPSHLIVGAAHPSRDVAIVGHWENRSRFFLRTVYAGPLAPREVHDPGIKLEEIDDSIRFWTTHALVVDANEKERPANVEPN